MCDKIKVHWCHSGLDPESRNMSKKSYYVYILTSKRNGTLYTGITNDLMRRISEHKNNLVDGFTKKHTVHTLVYYEQTESVEAAISREKQLKNWHRAWKLKLIETTNPDWKDLYITL